MKWNLPPLFSRIAEGGEKKEQKKAAAESNFQGRGAGVGFFFLSPPFAAEYPSFESARVCRYYNSIAWVLLPGTDGQDIHQRIRLTSFRSRKMLHSIFASAGIYIFFVKKIVSRVLPSVLVNLEPTLQSSLSSSLRYFTYCIYVCISLLNGRRRRSMRAGRH